MRPHVQIRNKEVLKRLVYSAPLQRFFNYIPSKLSRIGKDELFSKTFFSSWTQNSHSNTLTSLLPKKEKRMKMQKNWQTISSSILGKLWHFLFYFFGMSWVLPYSVKDLLIYQNGSFMDEKRREKRLGEQLFFAQEAAWGGP